jgi:hypothetical protein
VVIADSYSSWCRNLLTREDRERIATAGDGAVRFSRGTSTGRRWVALVSAEGIEAVGFGATPGAAFDNALVSLRRVAA